MISPKEFLSRWHFSPLVQVPFETMQNLALPRVTVRFLAEIGLPSQPFLSWDLTFDGINDGLQPFPNPDSPYLCLATSDYSSLCLEAGAQGGVICFDRSQGGWGKKDTANSSLMQFVECLLAHAEWQEPYIINENKRWRHIETLSGEKIAISVNDTAPKYWWLYYKPTGEAFHHYCSSEHDWIDYDHDALKKRLEQIDSCTSTEGSLWADVILWYVV